MPRTRYTRLVHDRDEARLDKQIRDTHRLVRALRRGVTEVVGSPVVLPVIADRRTHRRDRLEQKRRHNSDLLGLDMGVAVPQPGSQPAASSSAA